VRYNFTNAKQTLDLFRTLCQDQTKPHTKLCQLFDHETQDGKKMTHYNNLIKKAITAIIQQFQQKNAENLFTGRDGKLIDQNQHPHQPNDFELITWLIIMDQDSNTSTSHGKAKRSRPRDTK